ncbi:MAG: ATP-dependent Clp protease ATP-binding subunit, partial [Myxococcales bacterium]|nr:ATP-dependent Clp protease ATP-binding subunit [Myxococcales bacterium]
GEIPCMAATTEVEYRRHFEKDAALSRRFSAVRVQEPSPELALEILQGLIPKYEHHHEVSYTEEAVSAAVYLGVKYIHDRHLPDKAIGVLDLAAARVKRRGGDRVDLGAVASVIAEQTQVPLERLMEQDADRLLHLERRLANRVVGHSTAVTRIAEAVRKGMAGLRGGRPLGTFMLLGPTGVGKTEMAKAVAQELYPHGAMTRLDMSEFSEAHAVARLLGAPPGYVGHDEGGQLTEAVRRRPYQLVLLDEIEKAHPDVLLALLPLLDEGRLTDSRGRLVDFTHTVLFLTSNLGATATRESRIGFGQDGPEEENRSTADAAIRSARMALPPELWNRIDEPLYFAALKEIEVKEIAERMLNQVAETLLRERGVHLQIESSVVDALIQAGGFDPTLGARPMKRTLGRLVESPLANGILSERFRRGDTIVLRGDGDSVLCEVAAEAAE